MPAAILAVLLLAQSPARLIDEAAFLREASKGWAVLEKAYADIDARYSQLSPATGTVLERSFARLGKLSRGQRNEMIDPGKPQRRPGSVRIDVLGQSAFFIVFKPDFASPSRIVEYHLTATEGDRRSMGLHELAIREACFALSLRNWSQQVRREDFIIQRLEAVKDGSRELIRMEFREGEQPGDAASITRAWCHFDPKENYLPVESEIEFLQHATKAVSRVHLKIEHKPTGEFPGLRLVPSKVTREVLGIKGQLNHTTVYEFDSFKPCKLKEVDFRPEGFGLETPK